MCEDGSGEETTAKKVITSQTFQRAMKKGHQYFLRKNRVTPSVAASSDTPTLVTLLFMIGACTGEDVTSSMTEDNSERRDNDGQRRRRRRLQRQRRQRRLCGSHSDGTELTRNTSSSAVSEGQDDDDDDDGDEAAAVATTLTTTTENVELDVKKSDELEHVRDRVELVFRTPICSLSATE